MSDNLLVGSGLITLCNQLFESRTGKSKHFFEFVFDEK